MTFTDVAFDFYIDNDAEWKRLWLFWHDIDFRIDSSSDI